jgi:hypothetical protein
LFPFDQECGFFKNEHCKFVLHLRGFISFG